MERRLPRGTYPVNGLGINSDVSRKDVAEQTALLNTTPGRLDEIFFDPSHPIDKTFKDAPIERI